MSLAAYASETKYVKIKYTVEPAHNGPVLSGHPLLSFQSPDFSPIQTLYLLPVLGSHLYYAAAATLY